MMDEEEAIDLVGEETTCFNDNLALIDWMWCWDGSFGFEISMLKSPSRTRESSLVGGFQLR